MPSLLAEDPGIAAFIHSNSSSKKADTAPRKRTSADNQDERADRDLNMKNGEESADANGHLVNGDNKPDQAESRVNGETRNGWTQNSEGRPEVFPRMSELFTGLDGLRFSQDSQPPVDERQRAAGDEGRFASAAVGEEKTSMFGSTTAVSLSADAAALDSPTASKPDLGINTSSLPSRGSEDAQGLSPATDNSLKVPERSHRVSSPPALQSAASPGPAPQPPRLQQRHTLEVPLPRISTSRLSRDSQNDESGTSTGRFSPSHTSRRRASLNLARRTTRSIASDLHLDEHSQDEDAARWAEYIRSKRASKRKKRDDEEEDRVVVGTKVDQNHVNWVTAYNMLTGIRFTVSRTNAKMDRELTDADFNAKHKFSFDITGNELTPSAKYDFKFKDYAPWVFRHLRSIFKLDPADYLMSLTSKYILSELGSPGKSGSFFYFSRDYKYIIKTIHHAEHKFLRRVLKDYYSHVRSNPNTLLSQFYGLHRVKIPYGRKIHFVVMNNLFPPHRDIHHTFDLKGSTIGRDFKEEDLEDNPRATLKDLNWLRRDLHLEFGPTKKTFFIEQMERDVALLERLKIMDYSLLIGIHDLERGNEDKLRDKTLQVFQPGGEDAEDPTGGAQGNMLARTPSRLEKAKIRQMIKSQRPIPMDQAKSGMPDELGSEDVKKEFYFYSDNGGFRATHEDEAPGEEIYYLGIIDCLTHYGLKKRAEHFLKSLSDPESQISAIPPDRYGERFVRFISGIAKTKEAAEREKAEEARNASSDTKEHRRSGALSRLSGHGPGAQADTNEDAKTEKVIEKAEDQAEKSRRHGANENTVPNKTMTTTSGQTQDRGESVGYTLPVVEEDVEGGSTGGRSARSADPSPSPGGSQHERSDKKEQVTNWSRPLSARVDTPPSESRGRDQKTDGAEGGSKQPPKDSQAHAGKVDGFLSLTATN